MFAEGKKILKGRIKLIVKWDVFFSSLVVVVVGVMILLLLVPVVVGGVDVRL